LTFTASVPSKKSLWLEFSAMAESPHLEGKLGFGFTPMTYQSFDSREETYSQCVPFGRCEPCPPAEQAEPVCQPFGNRRLYHCIPENPSPGGGTGITGRVGSGEVPVWQPCGRVVEQETRDFMEFVFCNLALLLIALFIAFKRLKLMDNIRSRTLAARIWNRQ